MKNNGTKTWAMTMTMLLIVAIIGFGAASFIPGVPLAEWKIRIGASEASGSQVGLGFAFLLTVIFLSVWPDFRKAIFTLYQAVVALPRQVSRIIQRHS
jgi:hypothetical protein